MADSPELDGLPNLAGLRVGFAGTPEFASQALASLIASSAQVPLVLTQPDRPAGRGMKLQASAVKQLALSHGLPVAQPRSLRLNGKYPEDALAAQQALIDAKLDALVVAAYGLILPQWVLDAPSLGCFNIHASLLPRWRGAAPIHRAIEAGDSETGITIMQMDTGLDTGDMLLIERISIAPTDTTQTLHDKLAAIGGPLVVKALADARDGRLKPVKQPEIGITYAAKIDKAEAELDWNLSAETLCAKVRALNPAPGATATCMAADGSAPEVWKIWKCYVKYSTTCNNYQGRGLIALQNGSEIAISCAQGSLVITELQRAGGKRLSAAEFLRGLSLSQGARMAVKPEATVTE
jgi:methionyl-tRNA formyltransferase